MSSTLPILTDDPATWKGSSFVSVDQLQDHAAWSLLTRVADAMQQVVQAQQQQQEQPVVPSILPGTILATLFYEASTRTSTSFQVAMQRLGGNFVHVDATVGNKGSSTGKGESLSDTVRCLHSYCDVVVLRHYETGTAAAVAAACGNDGVVINGGDGTGEHPTQALLDMYTLQKELTKHGYCCNTTTTPSTTDDDCHPPVVIVLVGDLLHGRTVHSLVPLLRHVWKGAPLQLRAWSPSASLALPDAIAQHDECPVTTYDNLDEACTGAHVLYVTRIQKERFASSSSSSSNPTNEPYVVVTPDLLSRHATICTVLHPLPRNDEISVQVDTNEKVAAYFRQMHNGLLIRMALLTLIRGRAEQVLVVGCDEEKNS